MIILKHVEYGFEDMNQVDRLVEHLRETTSQVEGLKFRDIWFPKGKKEFALVIECDSEDRYNEWRNICPPPQGAKDWYEVFLTKFEKWH